MFCVLPNGSLRFSQVHPVLMLSIIKIWNSVAAQRRPYGIRYLVNARALSKAITIGNQHIIQHHERTQRSQASVIFVFRDQRVGANQTAFVVISFQSVCLLGGGKGSMRTHSHYDDVIR